MLKIKQERILCVDEMNIHKLTKPILLNDRRTVCSEVLIYEILDKNYKIDNALYLCIPVKKYSSIPDDNETKFLMKSAFASTSTDLLYGIMGEPQIGGNLFITVNSDQLDPIPVGFVVGKDIEVIEDSIKPSNARFPVSRSEDSVDFFNTATIGKLDLMSGPARVKFLNDIKTKTPEEVDALYGFNHAYERFKAKYKICQFYGIVNTRDYVFKSSNIEKRIEARWTTKKKVKFIKNFFTMDRDKWLEKYDLHSMKTASRVLYRIANELDYNIQDIYSRKAPIELVSDKWSSETVNNFLHDSEEINAIDVAIKYELDSLGGATDYSLNLKRLKLEYETR